MVVGLDVLPTLGLSWLVMLGGRLCISRAETGSVLTWKTEASAWSPVEAMAMVG